MNGLCVAKDGKFGPSMTKLEKKKRRPTLMHMSVLELVSESRAICCKDLVQVGQMCRDPKDLHKGCIPKDGTSSLCQTLHRVEEKEAIY